MVPKRLQGRYRPQQALFHGYVRKAHEVHAYALFDAHLRSYLNGIDANALGRKRTYQHIRELFDTTPP